MSDTAEKLKTTLSALPKGDRAELVHFLLDTLDDDGDDLTEEEWDAAWLPVLNRRVEEIKSGKVEPIPVEELLRRMREKYP
jgi:putative addiction module component (TIGR02574 family)